MLLFFIAASPLYCIEILGQYPEKTQSQVDLASVYESVVLFTDRPIYVAGEDISFSAQYAFKSKDRIDSWSKILYLELIEPDGTPVSQDKYRISEGTVSDKITIPNEIKSGNYYLRAYTKWMRNFPSENYGYARVKIINPLSSAALGEEIVSVSTKFFIPVALPVTKKVEISLSKPTFTKRELVECSIYSTTGLDSLNNVSISVVNSKIANFSAIKSAESISTTKEFKFLPEAHGLNISGNLMFAKTDKPAIGIDLFIALVNDQSYFSSCKTDRFGQFSFTLPEFMGKHDFLIQGLYADGLLEINLQQEYCSRPVDLEFIPFTLSNDEEELTKQLYANKVINQQFSEKEKPEAIKPNRISFYGKPDKTLHSKDYIAFNTIQDFVFELIPEIRVKTKRSGASIIAKNKNTLSPYPFLVMIDNILIQDQSEFLNTKMDRVERIELVNGGYIAGDAKFSGVIHAITYNKDFAGITLPTNSMFFSYELLTTPSKTKELQASDLNDRSPLRKNTLYWNPEFLLTSEKKNFSFISDDQTGEYTILVFTIGNQGNPEIIGVDYFEVK